MRGLWLCRPDPYGSAGPIVAEFTVQGAIDIRTSRGRRTFLAWATVLGILRFPGRSGFGGKYTLAGASAGASAHGLIEQLVPVPQVHTIALHQSAGLDDATHAYTGGEEFNNTLYHLAAGFRAGIRTRV